METVIDIKALRERLGWTQTDLADWLGVSQCSVSRMEARGSVRAPTLRLLKMLEEQSPAAGSVVSQEPAQ